MVRRESEFTENSEDHFGISECFRRSFVDFRQCSELGSERLGISRVLGGGRTLGNLVGHLVMIYIYDYFTSIFLQQKIEKRMNERFPPVPPQRQGNMQQQQHYDQDQYPRKYVFFSHVEFLPMDLYTISIKTKVSKANPASICLKLKQELAALLLIEIYDKIYTKNFRKLCLRQSLRGTRGCRRIWLSP